MSNTNNVVWGSFCGEGGYLLPVFNSQARPFPPVAGDSGFCAIGWSKLGAMVMYENNYSGFEAQFLKCYPDGRPIQASEVWRFAFEAKVGDFVISPSAETGFLLVGKITSDYLSDHDGEFGFLNYRHLRKVEWLYIIPQNDSRYSQLNRIGMLTFAKLNRTIAEVQAICETK